MSNPGGIRKARNWTAVALFLVALSQGTLGYVGWAMNGHSFGWLDWVFSFSGVVFLGLAIAARRVRFPAALMGAGLYASFLSLQWWHGFAALKSGLIFKVPIVVLLILAVMCGLRSGGTAAPRP